ncbi:hypothetical protein [Tenacibaculum amylolyticum]
MKIKTSTFLILFLGLIVLPCKGITQEENNTQTSPLIDFSKIEKFREIN